jgi:hypothetical protein
VLPVWAGTDGTMGRLLLAAAAIYCAGYPALEHLRPASFERPLKNFNRTVDAAVSDGRRAAIVLDDARRMRYLQTLIDRWPQAF